MNTQIIFNLAVAATPFITVEGETTVDCTVDGDALTDLWCAHLHYTMTGEQLQFFLQKLVLLIEIKLEGSDITFYLAHVFSEMDRMFVSEGGMVN